MARGQRNENADPLKPRRGGRRGRQVNTRVTRRRFLIICEGAKTEPNYFRGFRVPRHIAEIVGAGDNTFSLVQQAIRLRDDFLAKGETFDEIWCVFDRDSFPAQQFNAAINLAQREGMHVAYSNEAFELWYVLHLGFHQSSWTRHQLIDKLRRDLSGGYEKNRTDIYDVLRHLQNAAIRNAHQLIEQWRENPNPESNNPSTTVYQLVEKLRENSPG